MKCGPAEYIVSFLKTHGARADTAFTVVTDFSFLNDATLQPVCGHAVMDYANFEESDFDIAIAFIGNGDHHAFIYRQLLKEKRCFFVTVVHDLSVIDIARQACLPSGDDVFREHLPGPFYREMMDWSDALTMPLAPAIFLCQTATLNHSDIVIAHSYYAALKLRLEAKPSIVNPTILVMRPPSYDDQTREPDPTEPLHSNFRVGVFDWVSTNKRPSSIIKAYAEFLKLLDPDERKRTELIFVGQYNPYEIDELRIVESAAAAGIPSHVVPPTGFVDAEAFQTKMKSCSLLVNLRYPSSGESSGPLRMARQFGIMRAVSAYQAYYEVDAEYHIRVSPQDEISDLRTSIMDAFQKWRAGAASQRRIDWRTRLTYLSADEAMDRIVRTFFSRSAPAHGTAR
jgi:hypothetical protein